LQPETKASSATMNASNPEPRQQRFAARGIPVVLQVAMRAFALVWMGVVFMGFGVVGC
jgi:hypothetical protein